MYEIVRAGRDQRLPPSLYEIVRILFTGWTSFLVVARLNLLLIKYSGQPFYGSPMKKLFHLFILLSLSLCLSVSATENSPIEVEIIEIEAVDEDKIPKEKESQETGSLEYQKTGEWQFAISVGYGQVESIIANVDDYDLYLLPSIRYYGENLFLDNTTIGYTLFENPDLYIDLVGRLNDDGIYFKLDDFGVFTALGIQPPLRDPRIQPEDVERDISYLAGVAVNYSIGDFDIRSGYFQDVTDVHNGYEVDLSVSYGLMITDKWSLGVRGSAIHKSKKLLNYYYGTRPEEALLPAFSYQPNSSGTNYAFSLDSEYIINDSWSWQLNYRRNFLAHEITDSEIISTDEPDTYFLGIKYRF